MTGPEDFPDDSTDIQQPAGPDGIEALYHDIETDAHVEATTRGSDEVFGIVRDVTIVSNSGAGASIHITVDGRWNRTHTRIILACFQADGELGDWVAQPLDEQAIAISDRRIPHAILNVHDRGDPDE